MKIAIILGSYSVGSRPLNFSTIWENKRGLTGTDLSALMISKELQKLNHDVYLFTIYQQPLSMFIWEDIKIYKLEARHTIIDETFDCVISINEPDILRGINSQVYRICWQFLNDFSYCQSNFDQEVDQWLSVCEKHKNYLLSLNKDLSEMKWKVVPLGCDPNLYQDRRVPGRVIWCSSADRGLHNLLEIWTKIKKEAPLAHLKIFYHFEFGNIINIEPNNTNYAPHIVEMGHRLRYIKEAIIKLKPLGVEHVGSISREQMQQEMSQASVFAFPCDTVSMTEGFSISSMEAHASFTVPVMTDADCLGSIYQNSGAVIINSPVRHNLSKFSEAVIRGLTDKSWADNVIKECRQFSFQYSWAEIAKKMEQVISSKKVK